MQSSIAAREKIGLFSDKAHSFSVQVQPSSNALLNPRHEVDAAMKVL